MERKEIEEKVKNFLIEDIEVDEDKITDKDYYNFIQYMKIIRQNMYKLTQTTV